MKEALIKARGAPWPVDKLLAEARRRTKKLSTDNSARVSRMLERLLKEAGWSSDAFLDAMTRDLIRRNPVSYR